jgi:HPt (histidine-containing phosphotransfer) domain-containing protein
VPTVNFPELLLRVDNDRELLRDLIIIFRDEFPNLVQDLRQAIANNNSKQAITASHTLKGMLANLAVSRATAAAAELEQKASMNDSASLQQSFSDFERETSGLMKEMESYLAEEPAE